LAYLILTCPVLEERQAKILAVFQFLCMKWESKKKKNTSSRTGSSKVAHTCNPSYSGGGRKITTQSTRPYEKNN
jgi:hypothetical protein